MNRTAALVAFLVPAGFAFAFTLLEASGSPFATSLIQQQLAPSWLVLYTFIIFMIAGFLGALPALGSEDTAERLSSIAEVATIQALGIGGGLLGWFAALNVRAGLPASVNDIALRLAFATVLLACALAAPWAFSSIVSARRVQLTSTALATRRRVQFARALFLVTGLYNAYCIATLF